MNNNNGKKFNFNRNSNPAPVAKQNNVNQANFNSTINDNDEDFLDISDTELIRASQVVESQLKFTNNVHHTTSNALTIFSQFNNDGFNTSMAPPSTLIMGAPSSTTIYSNSHNLDSFSQLEDVKSELKQIRNENMLKEGEVKILRDKLKRTEQEMQRVRTEKADLVKKLQIQQEEAKKALQKQIDLKELENQIKSQEVVELTMKYKVLESTVKKNPIKTVISSTPSANSAIQNSSINSTAIPNNMSSQQQFSSQCSVFDDAFSLNKKMNANMAPPQSSTNQAGGRKRLAPMSTSSLSLSDNENENPIQENKRPTLVQQSSLTSSTISNGKEQSIAKSSVINTPTTVASNRHPLSPFSGNSSIINPQAAKTTCSVTKQATNTPSIPPISKQTPLITASPFNNLTDSKRPVYKRASKLNLKPINNIMTYYIKELESNERNKSKTNEKIYKLIDLFSVSESILKEFNKSTSLEKPSLTNPTLIVMVNLNATICCFESLSQQLNSLLECISYKSEATAILNDLFTVATANLTTGSSSSNLTSNSSLLLIIERVEFVSNQLNEELVKLIKYCLSASLQDGLVVNKSSISLISSDCFKKIHSSIKTTPATIISIVDLLCLSFEVCYSLFLFRVKFLHSQNELNKKKLNKLIKTNSKNQSATQFIYNTLIKLKQEFFKLIVIFLKSINFSAAITTPKSENSKQPIIVASAEASNLSNSSTSYSTLKILNSIMDCFNHLIYLPVLNKKLEPDSLLTIFYFSLIDNMHNIFKKKLYKFSKLFEESNEAENKQDEETMVEDNDDDDDCFSNEFEDDDEPCLFKLFYEKIIKYFGEIVYSLEFNENISESNNTNDENSSILFNNINSKQDISIITTIVADDEASRQMNDFSTEKQLPVSKLTTSKSQNDLLETLQSQTPLDEDWKLKFDFDNSNVNTNSCSLQNSSSTSNRCIHLLQTQLLSNFIHFLHNYQLFSSFIQMNLNENNKTRICFENTHHKQCLCYKDLLLSFLILIDYQFNEKFICGASLCIEDCFHTAVSSFCLQLLSLANKNNEDSDLNSLEENNLSKSRNDCNLNKKTNRFMFLLIMRCCNALVTLFNHDELNNTSKSILDKEDSQYRQPDEQKFKFYESIKDDYRLKNFYCLYALADLNYEDFLAKSFSKISIDDNQQKVINQNEPKSHHLFTSLNSLRNLFKTYMDDYFDLD